MCGATASVTYAFDVFNNVPSIGWAPTPNVLGFREDDLTVGGELQTQFFHNGNGFYSNGGTVKLCVARTDNAAVVIDGVELTEACAVGLNVAPSALGTSNFLRIRARIPTVRSCGVSFCRLKQASLTKTFR